MLFSSAADEVCNYISELNETIRADQEIAEFGSEATISILSVFWSLQKKCNFKTTHGRKLF